MSRFSKRLFDAFGAIVGIVLTAPVWLVVALLVRIRLGSPVLFKQERPGLRGKTFVMLKFRSMTNEKDENGVLLPNERRLTPFGKALRASSLDELPELINVLRGEMSLVGPRPLRVSYLSLYTKEQARRHDVRPGVTGWAQVNGRNALDWERRFEYDVWYVDHRSFWLDLKIIFLTFRQALRRDGADNLATPRPAFGGSAEGSDVDAGRRSTFDATEAR